MGKKNRPGLGLPFQVYWVGQKDCLGFSVISYGKNPNDLFGQPCIMMVCLMGVLESSTAVPPVRRKIDLSFSGNLLEAPFQELNDIIYMK